MVTVESVPPYQRIANDLEADITSGRLARGARVPSLTTLSQEYGVAKNTVIKAIDTLKAKEIIESRQGWGTFVK
ncbi:MAG TPA: winged helix-turn-helix domain-containing protein [Trebonia sp.]